MRGEGRGRRGRGRGYQGEGKRPSLHHLLLCLALGRHHAVATPREGPIDVELGDRGGWRGGEELDDGAAEYGGPAGGKEGHLAVGVGAEGALPALVEGRATDASSSTSLASRPGCLQTGFSKGEARSTRQSWSSAVGDEGRVWQQEGGAECGVEGTGGEGLPTGGVGLY